MERFNTLYDHNELRKETCLCRRCSLRSGCQQVVPGIGPHNAKIMFVADYPTSEDELYGEPIVGRPGILLEQLLSEADIEKQNTYITYAVKCKTPKNRIPKVNEIKTCKFWLWQEMQVIQPKVIITLGKIPTELLLKKKHIKMADLAGNFYVLDYFPAELLVCYHPSYLLRRDGQLNNMVVSWFKKIKEKSEQ
jgi:uracil-DNA glycosylase family 4